MNEVSSDHNLVHSSTHDQEHSANLFSKKMLTKSSTIHNVTTTVHTHVTDICIRSSKVLNQKWSLKKVLKYPWPKGRFNWHYSIFLSAQKSPAFPTGITLRAVPLVNDGLRIDCGGHSPFLAYLPVSRPPASWWGWRPSSSRSSPVGAPPLARCSSRSSSSSRRRRRSTSRSLSRSPGDRSPSFTRSHSRTAAAPAAWRETCHWWCAPQNKRRCMAKTQQQASYYETKLIVGDTINRSNLKSNIERGLHTLHS